MGARYQAGDQDATREKLLAAAHRQFAERGFYGASIAQIAGEVGLTKQALLYHFKRKEDLYGEVLKRISLRLIEAVEAEVDEDATPEEQFEAMIVGIYRAARENTMDARVLLREALDHQRRDAPEDEWYFKAFLENALARLDAVEGMADLPFAERYARVWFLAISIEYSVVSGETLSRFYGEDEARAIEEAFLRQLRAQVKTALKP